MVLGANTKLREVCDHMQLLPLGLVRSGAFPAVRLPLFVQATNTHSLATTHRNVLLHQAGQHACKRKPVKNQ